MKKCKKCREVYDDNHIFCSKCGNKLSSETSISQPRKVQIFIVVGLLVVFLLLLIGHESIQFRNQKQEIAEYRRNRSIEEYQNTPRNTDLTINSNWNYHREGNYIYIDGSVSNNSSKDISYYEIGVKFLDSNGTVLDTDWTNGFDLYSGDTQQFEIMHKHINFNEIKLYVKEVS